jgi:eukaryotic-like serine/threonine-protein kinase
MTLPAGSEIGPYVVTAPLGAGGMGEVYRARDNRLGRDVALKVLTASFVRDGDRLQRFEQEARAVATLNHPNVMAVFDVGVCNGSPYLVSELLEGETLRDALEGGGLAQRTAIDYGVQIAQGLAAAHEKGVVHRDLKPENIFITRDCRIKILDFGVAKLEQKTGSGSDGATLTSLQTAAGVVLGTASYMAPEQVRGDATDARTDIFAFGAVLMEMLSGQRLFLRDTMAETMTAVLKDDPPELSATAARPISPALERIARRCLEKNPEQRFQSAKDLSFALSAPSGSDSSGSARAVPSPPNSSLRLWSALALAVAVTAAAMWFLIVRPAPEERVQFAIPVPGEVSHMALSLDGTMLAFVAPEDSSGLPILYVQRVGSAHATVLPGTEGVSYPFWSPNADYIGFFANGKLKKIAASGGTPQVLASAAAGRGGSWGKRDVILFSPAAGSAVWRINADGTGAEPLTEPLRRKEDMSHRWPVFLPDGDHFLFWAGNFTHAKDDRTSGIYASSLDKKDRKLVLLGLSSFGLDSSHLYYADADRHLVRQAFDTKTAALSGSPETIAGQVRFQPSTFWAAIAASSNGTLIFDASTGAALSVLTWVDRSGKELERLGTPAVIANPNISPDGKRVSVDISDEKTNNVDIWLQNIDGSGTTSFTLDPMEEVNGVWSRDGKMVAYRAASLHGTELFVKRSNGLEREKSLYSSPAAQDVNPNSWSPDDQQILCTVQSLIGGRLEMIPATGGAAVPFLSSNSNETNGQFSPDGKWVAYASDQSGNWEIYVTTYPGRVGKWQISHDGGREPRWSRDGKEIFFLGPKGMLMVAPVGTENGFSTGAPTALFQIRGRAQISSTDLFTYDVSKDGSRLLVNRYVKPDHPTPLTIILHSNAK